MYVFSNSYSHDFKMHITLGFVEHRQTKSSEKLQMYSEQRFRILEGPVNGIIIKLHMWTKL